MSWLSLISNTQATGQTTGNASGTPYSGTESGGGGGGYAKGEVTSQQAATVARSSDKTFSAGLISKNINNPNKLDFGGSAQIAIVAGVALFGLYLFFSRGR